METRPSHCVEDCFGRLAPKLVGFGMLLFGSSAHFPLYSFIRMTLSLGMQVLDSVINTKPFQRRAANAASRDIGARSILAIL
jgi:hypothetical protein